MTGLAGDSLLNRRHNRRIEQRLQPANDDQNLTAKDEPQAARQHGEDENHKRYFCFMHLVTGLKISGDDRVYRWLHKHTSTLWRVRAPAYNKMPVFRPGHQA
ncbi:hypothetical protein EDF81_2151 [Enterobacter sp. BIGb0383]|nr:hypothetical protein EDF81_2151 [Enterobacter sp. BIGb0383]ROS09182.1 hypothetical protein EC848_2689 [Enterobacter sp. BIGb0359]